MTSLLRRDPGHVLDLPDWMSRFFDDRGLHDPLLTAAPAAIRLEEWDEEGVHVLRAELPGIDPDKDVDITLHDGMLHIAGSRTEKQEERERGSYRSEFRYGRFERAVPLPAGTTAQDVLATYKDGVLEVRLPMDAKAREVARVSVQRIE